MKLTQKITLITITTGIFLAIFSVIIVSVVIRKQLEQQIGQQKLSEAQSNMNTIDRVIESRIEEIGIISGEKLFTELLLEVNDNSYREAQIHFQELLARGIYDAFIIVNDENIIQISSHDNLIVGDQLSLSEHAQVALDALQGKASYSSIHNSLITGNRTLTVSSPIDSIINGQRVVHGAIIAEISWPAVSEAIGVNDSYTYLVDENGNTIASKGIDTRTLPIPEIIIVQSLNGDQGWQIVSVANEGRFLATINRQKGFLDFYGHNWSLVTLTSTNIAFSTVSVVTLTIAGLFIVLTFVIALLMIQVTKTFVLKPLRELSGTMRSVKAGHLEQRSKIKSHDELGDVADSFNKMTTTIQQAEINLIKLQDIVDRSPAIVLILKNTPGWPVAFAAGNLNITGYSKEEMYHPSFAYAEIMHPDDIEHTRETLVKAQKNHHLQFSLESRIKTKNGEVKWMNYNVWAQRDVQGKVISYEAIGVDVTKRHEAEEIIRLERNRFSLILKSIGDGIVVIDADKNILLVNPVAEKLIGVSANDMYGKPYIDFLRLVHEGGKKTSFDFVDWVFEHGMIANSEDNTVLIQKGGKLLPIDETAAPLVGDNAEVFGAVIVFRDVSKERVIDRMKSDFVSVASHQLKTPLSRMNWFLELLLDGDFGKITSEGIDISQDMVLSNKRMISLVKDLLNVSRIDRGIGLVLEKEKFNLYDNLHTIVANFSLHAKNEGKELNFPINGLKDLEVIADKGKLEEIVKNLLSNAIKYSEEGDTIELSIKQDEKQTTFAIKDSGIGIPKSDQGHMFEQFYRANNAIHHSTEGTGIGLSIAKSFVESHGGEIWFTSEEGKGSTFFFSIPNKV